MPSQTFLNLDSSKQNKLLDAAMYEFKNVRYTEVSVNQIIQNVGISILYAMNLQAFRSMVLIVIAILNIIISIPIAKTYGAIGVAYVTAGTLVLGNFIIMNIYYHKRIGINIIRFWKSVSVITTVVLFSISIGFLMNYLFPYDTLIFFIPKILAYTFIHVIIIYFIAFNDYEKEIVISAYNRLKKHLIPNKTDVK